MLMNFDPIVSRNKSEIELSVSNNKTYFFQILVHRFFLLQWLDMHTHIMTNVTEREP